MLTLNEIYQFLSIAFAHHRVTERIIHARANTNDDPRSCISHAISPLQKRDNSSGACLNTRSTHAVTDTRVPTVLSPLLPSASSETGAHLRETATLRLRSTSCRPTVIAALVPRTTGREDNGPSAYDRGADPAPPRPGGWRDEERECV